MEIYELTIKDDTDEVFAISLVEEPAIQSNFVYFNKMKELFAQVNKEQRLVMGPILIPDLQILRVDGEGKPYQVFFSKETVKQLAQNYLKKKYTDQATIEHENSVEGVHLVESWIKESKFDKSSKYGLKVPEGTWMGTFKIENDELWDEYVKTGKVRGFSIEGLFEHEFVKRSNDFYDTELMTIMNEETDFLLSQIRALIKKDKRTRSGERIEMESYSDYGQSIRNNARRGIELNEKNNNKCGTQVGKVRAQQLADGKPISLQTIKRMHSYLNRAETYYDNADSQNECGYISYLLWGGKSALSWSRNKLRELGELEENQEPTLDSTYPGEASGSYQTPETLQKAGELDVFGYETEYFYICPGAVQTFTHLIEMNPDEETRGMIRSAALQADKVFEIEARVVNLEAATLNQLTQVKLLVEDFYDLMGEIDEELGMEHDVSYMDGHIRVIETYLRDE